MMATGPAAAGRGLRRRDLQRRALARWSPRLDRSAPVPHDPRHHVRMKEGAPPRLRRTADGAPRRGGGDVPPSKSPGAGEARLLNVVHSIGTGPAEGGEPPVRPVRLNLAMASLFAVGSACFALGSVPGYASAVGATADSVTFFVGSLLFTAASLPPARAGADAGDDRRRRADPARAVPAASCAHGCRRTAAGSRPPFSSPAPCSSTSAPSRRWSTTPPRSSRTGTSGGRTCSGRSCSSPRACSP